MAWRLHFLKGILVEFLAGGEGRIEVAIWDGAGELDRTARSLTSMTPQSTSIRGGGGWNSRGMVWRLCFMRGFLSFVFWGGGWINIAWQIRPHRPIADVNITTINERMRGRGLERPGYGFTASVL